MITSNEINISIIIVNYNVKDFLLQCLRSIRKASNNLSVEIIVVDNNSSDGSVGFLKPLFPEVNFIELNQNLGFGKANNIAIKESIGKYVLFLNPDTILEEKTLEIMLDYMSAHPEVGISGPKVLNPDGSFQLSCRRGFPTPWASFCKLFGLQKLFPKSKLFASYNQSFRDIDESCYIDSIGGAFMFVRRSVINQIEGFDEDFFMYGEDIDFCWRSNEAGWKIAYTPETSIIHYKGESTKRSSINEVRHFYEAMEIFARKHYSHSALFLLFLKLGILIRSVFAYFNKNKLNIGIILYDIISINLMLIISTKIRFDDFFNFPNYAYPTVFIVISLILFGSMIGVGEYFEGKPSIRKFFWGMMVSFFILSSLTYFFKEYAFSRGVLLMTIFFTIIFSTIMRLILSFYDKISGKESVRRIAIVGLNDQTENLINTFQNSEAYNADIVGLVSVSQMKQNYYSSLPIIGNIEYLSNIIEDYKIREVIITERSIDSNEIMKIISNLKNPAVRFHFAQEYEDVLAARIINDITGSQPTVPKYNINLFRNKLMKRIFDIFISVFFLTIGSPLVFLIFKNYANTFKKLTLVLAGRYSFIGLFHNDMKKPDNGKVGIIGLAHISRPERLSQQAINNLNNYYLLNFSLSLDLDIFIKYLFRN